MRTMNTSKNTQRRCPEETAGSARKRRNPATAYKDFPAFAVRLFGRRRLRGAVMSHTVLQHWHD